MSRSNAAAIRRRVTNVQNPPTQITPTVPPTPPPVQPKTTGLTLQQFISALDKRVETLEGNINKTIEDSTEPTVTDLLDEFQSRFEMIATEMADIKDAMLKLQTYTMDVNKMLLDERIQILSQVNPNSTPKTLEQDTDLNSVISIGANTINTEHTSVDMRELVENEINKQEENETV